MNDTYQPRYLRSRRDQQNESEDERECGGNITKNSQWKKTILVGSSYQAVVSPCMYKSDNDLPHEDQDTLVWNPHRLSETEVDDYLAKVQEISANNSQGIFAIPTGAHVRDNEEALYLLVQCDYNVEEALRRRQLSVVPHVDTMSLWSDEECLNFEIGLCTYGKNFHLIQQNKVRTRSVAELVQFYYLWKKSERHDTLAQKIKLNKKKYTLDPETTDYMEYFLDGAE